MSKTGKIGVGIITYNRESFFRKTVSSVIGADSIVIVNDGMPYISDAYPTCVEIIQHRRNKGIAHSKNDALRYLLNENCEHIFICEDDVYLANPEIINSYIRASKETGILHFNYGFHSPINRDENGVPVTRKSIPFGKFDLIFTKHVLGAFSYYRDIVIKDVGFMDTRYKNVYEHVDHTYQIIKSGYHPPFWWFADLAESIHSIGELDIHQIQSQNMKNAFFYKLRLRAYGIYSAIKNGQALYNIPDTSESDVMRVLEEIKTKDAKK